MKNWKGFKRVYKMKKSKFLSIITALIILFILAACSSDDNDMPADDIVQPPATSSPEPAPEETPEPFKLELDFSNKKITDAQLVELLANGEIPVEVTNLKLNDNQISDITPLATLVNLVDLELHENRIDDITPLRGLRSLEKLTLERNPLTYRLVNQLRTILAGCDIRFKGEWTVFVNGEEMEIDVVDTDRGPFIPLDVMRLFGYEISYVLDNVNYKGYTPFKASAIRLRNTNNDDPYNYGQVYHDDFLLYFDNNKMVLDYEFVENYPQFMEFDGIPHIFIHNFFHSHDEDETYRYGRPLFRRDNRTIWFEGETDLTYEYLPRPRPAHWRLFINDEEMPIEIIHEPDSFHPRLNIYVSDFFDLYDFNSEYIYKWNFDTVNVDGEVLALQFYGSPNDRGRYGLFPPEFFTHPQPTLEDFESGVFGQSSNWGVQTVIYDEYEWILHFTSTWPNPGDILQPVSIEDLPPLIIAPPPPHVPEIERGFEAFYRQRDEKELTNKDLADAVASGKIPADTTALWIRLWGDNITDLSPLSELKNLKALRISDTQVSDLSPLSNMQNLQEIWIERSPVSDLSPLAGMPSLRELHIESVSTLKDITPLSEITNLTHLGLVSTSVRDIAPIRSLTNLETLNLRNSPVRDINHLHGMTNFTELFLGGTRVTQEQITAYQNSHPGCKIDQGVPT